MFFEVEVNLPVLEDKIFITLNRLAKFDKKKKYLLSFSCGKDSSVLLDLAIKANLNIIPVFYYIIPELSYNEQILQWFEVNRNIKIHRMESAIYSRMKNADILCINKVWKQKANNVNPFKYNEKLAMTLFNYDYNMLGIKRNDSPVRRNNISKYGWFQEKAKKIYPIFDWSDRDCWMYIKHFNIPINKCYKWFGRSQDVVNFDHIYPLKKESPQDYEKFCGEFPLIIPMVWLYEKRNKQNEHKK